MQPNNNSSSGAQPNIPQTAPQTTPMNPDNGVVFKDKSKKSPAMIFSMIFLVLLATGGIGFGVWAMLSKNQAAAELNNQISDLESQLAEASITEVDETEVVVEGDGSSSTNTEDYIYIGEWGIKIKKGKDLSLLNMSLKTTDDGMESYIKVVPADKLSSISSMNSTLLGDVPGNFIVRSEQETIRPYAFMGIEDESSPIYNDGKYYYFVYQPTGFVTEGMEDSESIVNAYNKMHEILANPDNYSKI